MELHRLVYFTKSSGYKHDDEFPDHLKMVFIPKEGSQAIPALYYTREDLADKRLLLYFHGTHEDLGSSMI
jgi:hypothetical protein